MNFLDKNHLEIVNRFLKTKDDCFNSTETNVERIRQRLNSCHGVSLW